MFEDFGINAGFVEDLHAQYRQSPQSVDREWRDFFAAFERAERGETNGSGNGAAAPIRMNGAAAVAIPTNAHLLAAAALQGRVYQLVNAYRVRGHLFAKTDPLGTPPD